MGLQKLPTAGLDDINQRRRRIETLNNVLDFTFDDSRVRTAAEVAAGITPVNFAYAPIPFYDARRVGLVDDGGVADQTSVLVAAYAAAKAANVPLLLPPGTFRFTSTLVWDGYVDVCGSGKLKTILLKDGDFSGIDIGGNGRHTRYEDFSVTETSTGTTGSGMFVSRDEAHIQINNVRISDHGGIGLYLLNDGSGAGVHCQYSNLEILRNGSDGVRIDGHYAGTWENINSFGNTGWGFNVVDGAYHVGKSIICQNNTAGGTRIATQQNKFDVYGEANTGVDLHLTSTSFNNLISLYHHDGADKFIDDDATESNIVFQTSSNATCAIQAHVYNRMTRWTNDEGFEVMISGGHAGSGATGKKGGDVQVVGGNADGTSGLVHGGIVMVRGGVGANGGREGTVRIQFGDGPVTIGPILGPTNESVSLEFGSTVRVPLLPRLTSTERDALTAVNGMLLYNTTTNKAQIRAGGAWVDLH